MAGAEYVRGRLGGRGAGSVGTASTLAFALSELGAIEGSEKGSDVT